MDLIAILVPIIVALLTSIPGTIALIKQQQKVESEALKLKTEARKTEVDVAIGVQDLYQEMIKDIVEKSELCREEVKEMSSKLLLLVKQYEELKEINKDLMLSNESLKLSNNELSKKLDVLTTGVNILIHQLEEEGLTPKFKMDKGEASHA